MESNRPKERKNRILIVRLTDRERHSIEALALQTGMNLSEAARQLLRLAAEMNAV